MTAALLGLAAALVYGAADFAGGLTSRRLHQAGAPAGTTAVVLWSQVVGLAILLVLLLVDGRPLTGGGLAWGVVAGLGGGMGLLLLYQGLAVGRMSAVAPITASVAAVLPLFVGVLRGERPGVFAWVGIVLALLAIVLVSQEERSSVTTERGRRGLLLAVCSGIGFGIWFIALDLAGDGGFWPLLGARSSVPLVALVAVVSRQPVRLPTTALPGVLLAGLFDQAANVLYLLATRRGLLTLVAVLTSLYPASTIILARVVLGERFTRLNLAGLVAAGAGVALIAAG